MGAASKVIAMRYAFENRARFEASEMLSENKDGHEIATRALLHLSTIGGEVGCCGSWP